MDGSFLLVIELARHVALAMSKTQSRLTQPFANILSSALLCGVHIRPLTSLMPWYICLETGLLLHTLTRKLGLWGQSSPKPLPSTCAWYILNILYVIAAVRSPWVLFIDLSILNMFYTSRRWFYDWRHRCVKGWICTVDGKNISLFYVIPCWLCLSDWKESDHRIIGNAFVVIKRPTLDLSANRLGSLCWALG